VSQLKSFEDLACWKAGKELRVFIIDLTKSFPAEEKYALVSQIKRSSRSVTNNIAEGYGRFHFQENIQYCRQSRGSLYETLDHLMIAREEGFINDEQFEIGREMVMKSVMILNGFIKYLSEAKKKSNLVDPPPVNQ